MSKSIGKRQKSILKCLTNLPIIIILAKYKVLESYCLLEKGVVRSFVNDMDNNDITTEFFIDGDIVIIPSSLFQ